MYLIYNKTDKTFSIVASIIGVQLAKDKHVEVHAGDKQGRIVDKPLGVQRAPLSAADIPAKKAKKRK